MLREKEVIDRVTGVTQVRLRAWVSQGWVTPVQSENEVLFRELDVARCELIKEIEDELQVESGTVPLVLSLLDQVYGLRRELRSVVRALEQQPESVRQSVIKSLRQK